MNWIPIDEKYPCINKPYLVKYIEYIGITPIYGFKIIDWNGSFAIEGNKVITEYTDVPEHIWKLLNT